MSYQLPFLGLMPTSTWVAPRLQDLPQDWSEIPRISLDVETKDPELTDLGCGARRDGCHVVGFAIAFDFGTGPDNYKAYYLPVRHEDGGNMDREQVVAYLRDHLATYTGRIVGAELSYDGDYIQQEGISFAPDVPWFDVATTDSLIYEYHDSYTLESCARRRSLAGKDERLLRAAASFYGAENTKSILYRLHAKYVGPYAEQDVLLPLLIDDAQRDDIRTQGLERAERLEADVLPVTVAMRRWGIRIDQDAFEQVMVWTRAKQAAYLAQFNHACRHLLDWPMTMEVLRSPHDMQKVINALGLPPLPFTRKLDKKLGQYVNGQPSLEADTLKAYRDNRVDLLLSSKKLDKIITTYGPSIDKYMINGRVHGTLKSVRGSREGSDDSDDQQAGTVSRRFSHVHPNLGNQPNPTRDEDDALRVEMGTRWRSIFVPDLGCVWGLADFSQQEPRWIVNDAALLHSVTGGLPSAYEMMLAYHRDTRTSFHKQVAKITGLPGGPAKIAGLAKAYGAGRAKTAKQLEDKMLELDALYRSGKEQAPSDWKYLPPGWRATYMSNYGPTDWIPPGKCVGDEKPMPSPECAAIIDKLDRMAPFIKEAAKAAKLSGEQKGYIRLIDGSRSRFEWSESEGKYKETHKALNKSAQPKGAIQMKLFILMAHRAGLTPQMSVHDDLSRSVSGPADMKILKEIGENVVKFVGTPEDYWADKTTVYKSVVPWLVKVKIGTSYGTADSTDVEVA